MRAASGSQARGPNYTRESMPRWYAPARSHVPHRRWRRRVLSWPRKRRRKWRKWAGSGERWASHITNQTAATSRTCRQERAGWKEGHRRGSIAGPGRSALPSHGSKHRTGGQGLCTDAHSLQLTTPAASKPAVSVAPWPLRSMAHTAATLVARLSTSETPMSSGPC